MKKIAVVTAALLLGAGTASAACTGSNGRGWGSGNGKGEFEMTAADKTCLVSYPNYINSSTDKRTPATEVVFSKAPKSGKLGLSKQGIIYTPNAGFKGKDQFCHRASAPTVKEKPLSGCVTITVK